MRIRILASKKRLSPLKKKLKKAHIPYILACHLQIDAVPVPDPAYHFDADPDFYLMRIRMLIQVTKMMQIHADPDPQHCCNQQQSASD